MKQMPNILVVGGDTDWQQTICDILREEGHKPYPAFTHKEVEQILRQQSFDVAVIDPILEAAKNFSPKDLVLLQDLQRRNRDMQVIVVSHPLLETVRESITHLYPGASFLSKANWDKNYFISLVKFLVGEGPNTDDKRLRDILERSRYGTRPLTPPAVEHGVGHPKILCVERQQDWQRIFIELFNTENYFWRMASTDDQAWRILENESFHLLILNDYHLPTGDVKARSQLLDYLVEFRPRTSVLVLSNRVITDDITEPFVDYPVIGFMSKQDFDPDVLKRAVIQATQAPHLKIESLGSFRIWRNGQLLGHWQNPEVEKLVKILLTRQANGGQAVSARELMTVLWTKFDIESYKNLLPVINEARLALEPGINPRETSFILRNSTGFSLDISGNIEWDLLQFRELKKQGKYLIDNEKWVEAAETLEAARALYQGDYLAEDGDAHWVLDVRRQVSKEYIGILTDLADTYAALERYQDGISVCSEALVNDPLVESVYRRLMRFYYWQGQPEEALKTYRMCVKLFEELFGESPKPITRQLYDEIKLGQEIVNILL